jgi:uncharacterized phage protein gp47/JayE
LARTEAEISDAIKDYQMAAHPRLRDYTPLSVLTALNGALASQVRYIEQQNDAVAAALSIWTATETDLDVLILDRLLDGRYLGNYATGELVFYRRSAAGTDITIPALTKVSCPNDLGESLYFVTTEAATLVAGTKSVVVAARCFERGLLGNVPAGAVNKLYETITGIEGVSNPAAFSGGTDEETDTELRQRYIDVATLPGTATIAMLEAKLSDIDTVREAKVWNRETGDIEVVTDYTDGVAADSDDIDDCLLANMAAGVVARGVLAATLGASNLYELEDSYGGKIWVRPLEHITTEETIELTYTDQDGAPQTATVTVPAVTPRGTAVEVTLAAPTDRAVDITASDYVGAFSYDVLIGMGDYPRLYNLPEIVSVDVALTVVLTETPEADLEESIKDSITEFLNSFKIGETLEWSDLFKVVHHVYSSHDEDGQINVGQQFVGIDTVTALEANDGVTTITTLGGEIDIEDDSRIMAGTITVTVT